MKCSVEISYYPLRDDFKPCVRAFLEDLSHYRDIKVRTGSISTQVFGEYRIVMQALTECMERTFEDPQSIFVLKILGVDRDK